jgi:hypothetical protein
MRRVRHMLQQPPSPLIGAAVRLDDGRALGRRFGQGIGRGGQDVSPYAR